MFKKTGALLTTFYIIIALVLISIIFTMFSNKKSSNITPSIVTLKTGEKYDIKENIDSKIFVDVLTLDNEGIVSNNDNVLTGLKEGLAIFNIMTTMGNVELKVTVVGSTIIEVDSVTLNIKEITLNIGDTYQLETSINPSNSSNKMLSYSSSDVATASVSGTGYIVAKEEGTTTITVMGANEEKDICTVKVKKVDKVEIIDVTSISIIGSPSSLKTGGSAQLTISFEPNNATNKRAIWSSSNSNVATVKDGYVLALREGNVTITATSNNGKSASVNIAVTKPADTTPTVINPTGVTLNQTNITIYVGESYQLNATVSPSSASNKNVTWVSNSDIASVTDGQVVGKKAGNAIITATTSNGKTATASVIVKNKDVTSTTIDVTGITVSSSSSLIYVGGTAQLSATVSPSNATNKTITWSSSDNSVATIDSSGKVNSLENGVVTLTAKSNNGKTATYKVQINERRVIFVGASNITRFNKYKITGYGNYTLSNNRLFIIYESGTKVAWQLSESSGDGGAKLKSVLSKYSTISTYGVDCNTYYVVFSPPGNDVVDISGEANVRSNAVSTASKYNNFVLKLKGMGYNINTYLMSKAPLAVSFSSSDNIVSSTSSNAMKSGYRSPKKYEIFDEQLVSEINSKYSSTLKYLDYYTYFAYGAGVSTYKTEDGIHYNDATTKAVFNYLMGLLPL